jgi:hypothetical protein
MPLGMSMARDDYFEPKIKRTKPLLHKCIAPLMEVIGTTGTDTDNMAVEVR